MRNLLIGLVLFGVSSNLSAQEDNEASRGTLAGLPPVHVVAVPSEDPSGVSAGLTQANIQTDVELKLRLAGIQVLTDSVAMASRSLYLIVDLTLLTRDEQHGLYAYVIEVYVLQAAHLVRNPSVLSFATTWRVPVTLGTIGKNNLSSLRGEIGDGVNQFVNAYLAANPKH